MRLCGFLLLLILGVLSVSALPLNYAFADYSEYKQQQDSNKVYNLYKGAKEGTRYEYDQRYRSNQYQGEGSIIGQIIGWIISLVIFGSLGLLVIGMILQGLGIIKIEEEGSIQHNK